MSRDFAAKLFAIYPEWQLFSSARRLPRHRTEYLLVEIPSPDAADLAYPLVIHTDRHEVRINFDYFSYHREWPSDPGETSIWRCPLKFLAAIMHEDIAAASGWKGDHLSIAWIVQRGETWESTLHNSTLDRVRLRSWNGALNDDWQGFRDPAKT